MSVPGIAPSFEENAGFTPCTVSPCPFILLAEDDENDAFFFQRALRHALFPGQIYHATSGDRAIHWLISREDHQFPSLVFLDLKMPRVNGFETLKWIRAQQRFQNLPVIILSSSDLPEDRSRADRCGATAYYEKPCNLHAYEHLMSSILKKSAIIHLSQSTN